MRTWGKNNVAQAAPSEIDTWGKLFWEAADCSRQPEKVVISWASRSRPDRGRQRAAPANELLKTLLTATARVDVDYYFVLAGRMPDSGARPATPPRPNLRRI